MPRPTIAATMFEHARTAARRSTCPAAQVGAVIARDGVIVSVGYNGAPRGVAHCDMARCVVIPADIRHSTEDDFELRRREYSRHIHAETNAILHCARDGRSTDGCEMYVTMPPCLDCGKSIIQAGIRKVYVSGVLGTSYEDWMSTVYRFLNEYVRVEFHYI